MYWIFARSDLLALTICQHSDWPKPFYGQANYSSNTFWCLAVSKWSLIFIVIVFFFYRDMTTQLQPLNNETGYLSTLPVQNQLKVSVFWSLMVILCRPNNAIKYQESSVSWPKSFVFSLAIWIQLQHNRH